MKLTHSKFIEELADILEKYKASLYYTVNDDGIVIEIDNEEVFCGFLSDEPWVKLRSHLTRRAPDAGDSGE